MPYISTSSLARDPIVQLQPTTMSVMSRLYLSIAGLFVALNYVPAIAQSGTIAPGPAPVSIPGLKTVGAIDRHQLVQGTPSPTMTAGQVGIQHPAQIETQLKELAEQFAAAGLIEEARLLGTVEGRVHEVHFQRLLAAHQQRPAELTMPQISLKTQLIEVQNSPETAVALEVLFDKKSGPEPLNGPNLSGVFPQKEVQTWVNETNSTGYLKTWSQLQGTMMPGRSSRFRFGHKIDGIDTKDAAPKKPSETGATFGQQDVENDSNFAGVIVMAKVERLRNDVIGLELVAESQEVTGPGRPGVSKSRIQTNVDLRSGQTLVLTGMRSHGAQPEVTRVPVMGDIPVVGRLFSSRRIRQVTSDRMLLVTPEIIAAPTDRPGIKPVVQPATYSQPSR